MRAKILAAAVAGGALLAGGGFVAVHHTATQKEAVLAELVSRRDLNLVSLNNGLARLNDGASVLTQAPAPTRRPARRARINPISNVVQVTPMPTQVQAAPEPQPETAPAAKPEPEHPAAGPSAQPDEPVYTPGSIGRAKGRWTGRDLPGATEGADGSGTVGVGRGVYGGGGGECHGRGRGGSGHAGSGGRGRGDDSLW
jgi:hypothetical protein